VVRTIVVYLDKQMSAKIFYLQGLRRCQVDLLRRKLLSNAYLHSFLGKHYGDLCPTM
jgi:hypothetical protein